MMMFFSTPPKFSVFRMGQKNVRKKIWKEDVSNVFLISFSWLLEYIRTPTHIHTPGDFSAWFRSSAYMQYVHKVD